MKPALPITLAVVLASSTGAFAQGGEVTSVVSIPGVSFQVGSAAKDDFFAGAEKFAKGASKSTEVNLGPHSMNMVGSNSSSKDKDRDLAAKMQVMSVHEYTY